MQMENFGHRSLSAWNSFVQLREWNGSDSTQLYRIPVSDMEEWPTIKLREFLSTVERQLSALWINRSPTYAWTLSIPAFHVDGFDIDVHFDQDIIRASFGGLQQEFATVSGAITWVERALSNSYRLHTVIIGGRPREWRLEPVDGNPDGDCTLTSGVPAFFASLRSRHFHVSQNRAIASQ